MKFFKHSESNDVFSLEDGVEVPAFLVPMSDAEVETHLNPPLTPRQVQSKVAIEVDRRLDAIAQSWRYRDYISARSYRDDPNPRFAAEAAALIAHGSACWTVLDQLESAVLAGTAQMPGTVEEVLALLPDPPDRPGV